MKTLDQTPYVKKALDAMLDAMLNSLKDEHDRMPVEFFCDIHISTVVSLLVTVLTELETLFEPTLGESIQRKKVFNKIIFEVNKRFNLH